MSKQKYGFITKIISNFKMVTRVHAEEPTDSNDGTQTHEVGTEPNKNVQSQLNYEDLISRARKEEKDKLYPKIKALETDKATLTSKNNELILKLANLEEENKQLKSQGKVTESETVKKLEAELNKANKKVSDFEANLVDEDKLREDIRKELEGEYEVKLYRESKINEYKDKIIPDLVHGATKEEIDKSIESSMERFEAMKKQILGSTYIPPVNPSSSTFQQHDFNISDLANLDPRSPEYRELRTKLGLK